MENIQDYGSDDSDDPTSRESKSESKTESNNNMEVEERQEEGIKTKFSSENKTDMNYQKKLEKIELKAKELAASCQYIPMRLTESERLKLSVLENALEVCEYTDVVDVTFSHTRKNKYTRILESLIDTLSIACGLLTSNNLNRGEALLKKSLTENVPMFRDLFEVGRRYKIMNPSKMRNTYGKLMYLLMDAQSGLFKAEHSKIDFVKPILTIHEFLKQNNKLEMLTDNLLYCSTTINNVSRDEAKEKLFKIYSSNDFTREDIQRILDSIADNEAHKSFNVEPVEIMLKLLTENFDPLKPRSLHSNSSNSSEDDSVFFSLDLNSGNRGGSFGRKFTSALSAYGGFSSRYLGGGACLNHDHKTQFTFVRQSLLLWREVMRLMPLLWLLADADMLSEAYRLADTGQGYQRLQSCPRVAREMRRILGDVQSKTCAWVGLSVIHLGDRDVPNALVFIDKYTQVPRILRPISQCLLALPSLVQDAAFHQFVSGEWGSIAGLRMQVLTDFFKHGFDGSGDDGGSCIDGRLTSAWNWCSKLHKKPYYHVFMFTGFQGFDGDWKED